MRPGRPPSYHWMRSAPRASEHSFDCRHVGRNPATDAHLLREMRNKSSLAQPVRANEHCSAIGAVYPGYRESRS